mgnify:CR=1 FL=1
MKIRLALITVLISLLLQGCATEDLTTPCPDFGKHCTKHAVNGWQTS